MEENSILEDMRQQISLLKEKLESENIINDKLLRASMRQRLLTIRRSQAIEYTCALYVIIFGSLSFRMIGLDWWFIIATIVLMIGCMAVNFFMHRAFNRQDLYSDDLLSVAKTMKQLKHRYMQWTIVGIPAGLAWFGLLAFQMQQALAEEVVTIMITASAIGLVIGLIVGLYMTYRNRKACDDIIRQIED